MRGGNTTRRMFRIIVPLLLAVSFLRAQDPNVLVYGATPAGIAAAIAAAEDGEKVLLVEPTDRIGGMMTSGLSHTDFRTVEGLTGAYLKFTKRVEQHYREAFGADSPQVRDCWHGVFAEPKVNLAVFEKMLAEQPNITVWKNRRVFGARLSGDANGSSIGLVALIENNGRTTLTVTADYYIDATYEGDLLAAAKVPYRVGREGRGEYNEPLAPEQEDAQLQAYNFRLTATQNPENRVMPKKPDGYRREDFEGVLPLLKNGKFKTVFGYPTGCLFKAQTPPLPNGKYDINDVSGGIVRLSLPGENLDWPDGSGNAAVRSAPEAAVKPEVPFSPTGLAQARQRVFDTHLRWDVGLLYFLQNDEAVPAKFRDEARSWGWCRDEYDDNAHLPPQLYVREARRMLGAHVFTEHDTDHAENDARAVLHTDAIAMGDYGPNCHGTSHDGARFGGKHAGEFYKAVSPYQIPYGVLVPKQLENLLAPGPVSATHVGFCALRLEPIWMSLGEAAGHAAHLAHAGHMDVQRVRVPELQACLHGSGAATIYVSDVPPVHPDFAVVQWWATAGGLHGLAPVPSKPGQRGKNLHGQYFEAFPNHAAELDRVLDDALTARWIALATKLGLAADTLPKADGKLTRGEWLRAARALKK